MDFLQVPARDECVGLLSLLNLLYCKYAASLIDLIDLSIQVILVRQTHLSVVATHIRVSPTHRAVLVAACKS